MDLKGISSEDLCKVLCEIHRTNDIPDVNNGNSITKTWIYINLDISISSNVKKTSVKTYAPFTKTGIFNKGASYNMQLDADETYDVTFKSIEIRKEVVYLN